MLLGAQEGVAATRTCGFLCGRGPAGNSGPPEDAWRVPWLDADLAEARARRARRADPAAASLASFIWSVATCVYRSVVVTLVVALADSKSGTLLEPACCRAAPGPRSLALPPVARSACLRASWVAWSRREVDTCMRREEARMLGGRSRLTVARKPRRSIVRSGVPVRCRQKG